jgi:hypothetical protein
LHAAALVFAGKPLRETFLDIGGGSKLLCSTALLCELRSWKPLREVLVGFNGTQL